MAICRFWSEYSAFFAVWSAAGADWRRWLLNSVLDEVVYFRPAARSYGRKTWYFSWPQTRSACQLTILPLWVSSIHCGMAWPVDWCKCDSNFEQTVFQVSAVFNGLLSFFADLRTYLESAQQGRFGQTFQGFWSPMKKAHHLVASYFLEDWRSTVQTLYRQRSELYLSSYTIKNFTKFSKSFENLSLFQKDKTVSLTEM